VIVLVKLKIVSERSMKMKEKLMDLLDGAVDIHIHAGPATEDRKQDMIDVARAGRGASLEEQKVLASERAYLNYTMDECLPTGFRVKPNYIAERIKAVGPDHCLMGSDAGNPGGPNPLDAFKMFITIMLNRGISKQEIELMIKESPAKLLGL
jgi:predicted TIM-barrel fold metal-dependent hydrolase